MSLTHRDRERRARYLQALPERMIRADQEVVKERLASRR
jgi:hypothetical protein